MLSLKWKYRLMKYVIGSNVFPTLFYFYYKTKKALFAPIIPT